MKKILLLGGTGFVGTALCDSWATVTGGAGVRLIVPTRSRAKARHLWPLPNVDLIEADVHDDTDLRALANRLEPGDAVVNLIAILHGRARDFEQVHVTLPRRVVEAMNGAGLRRLIHVSALGVSQDAPSLYLRSKWAGEGVIRASGLDWTLLRPSVIFGERDRFLNMFAKLLAWMPVFPLAGAHARLQPVWVSDVALALARCLLQPEATRGQIFECAGPQVFELGELVRLTGEWSGHPRWVIPVPEAVGRLQAALLSLLPGEPALSADNLKSLRVPNVATGQHPGLQVLGLTPQALEPVAVNYLRDVLHEDKDEYNVLRRTAQR